MLGLLGKGSFGLVLKAFDHKEKENVAIKIVKNDAEYEKEAKNEVKILQHLLAEDLDGNGNVVHMKASFVFRNHTCIVFEMMATNLYELIKRKQFSRSSKVQPESFSSCTFSPPRFDLKIARNFTHSLLLALNTFAKMRWNFKLTNKKNNNKNQQQKPKKTTKKQQQKPTKK